MDIFWTFYLNHLSPLWGYFYEFLAVQKGHGSPGMIYGVRSKNTQHQNVINNYQFCGV